LSGSLAPPDGLARASALSRGSEAGEALQTVFLGVEKRRLPPSSGPPEQQCLNPTDPEGQMNKC
jgi:hypothetical protein